MVIIGTSLGKPLPPASSDQGLLQIAEHPYPDVVIEMFENNRECSKCGRSAYRYRWLVESDWQYVRDNRTTPSPWYCICGFEIGIKYNEE
ncbi:MAG: hypothetical protein IIA90_09330, partial [Chloroflexi bacterium]|nr:hypothetical protein [Chloroflexota bacterium]